MSWKNFFKIEAAYALFRDPIAYIVSWIMGVLAYQNEWSVFLLCATALVCFVLVCLAWAAIAYVLQKSKKPRKGRPPAPSDEDGVGAWIMRAIAVVVPILVVHSIIAFDSKTPSHDDAKKLSLPLATKADLREQVIEGKTVVWSDVPLTEVPIPFTGGKTTYVIENKRFVDCNILGPAVLAMGEFLEIGHSRFTGEPPLTLEASLMTVKGNYVVGATPVRNCGFLRCTFVNIAWAGSPEFIQKVRESVRSR